MKIREADSTVKFFLDSQSGIPGLNTGRDRNGWTHFLSPDAFVHLAVNRYPGVSPFVEGG